MPGGCAAIVASLARNKKVAKRRPQAFLGCELETVWQGAGPVGIVIISNNNRNSTTNNNRKNSNFNKHLITRVVNPNHLPARGARLCWQLDVTFADTRRLLS